MVVDQVRSAQEICRTWVEFQGARSSQTWSIGLKF